MFNQHSQLTINHSLTRLFICYEKFIQWWSTTLSISTGWTITSHLNSLIINKDHDRWRWKSRFLLGTNTKCDVVEQNNGIRSSEPTNLGHWVSRTHQSWTLDIPNPPILEVGYQTTRHLHIICTDSLPYKKTTYCHENE